MTEAVEVFGELAELPPVEARVRLEALLSRDPRLGELVRGLLDADREAGTFLENGVAEYVLGGDLAMDPDERAPAGGAGQVVGAYALVSLLGRGGMGEVWVAERRDGQFEQRVALKLLKRGIDSEGIRRRFLRERQVLARLNHPNIARLLDGGEADGRPYFVMELVEGEPITDYCRKRQLPLRDRLRLIQTCCEAIDSAHRRLIVHRDIKPSNVLVTADGRVKLLDFGIAKLLSEEGEDVEWTRADERVLTPAYAAPEQILGGSVTTATDVYALGVVLYQILTGVLPHARATESAARLASSVESETTERPSRAVGRAGAEDAAFPAQEAGRLAALFDDEIDAIVLKALRREPDRRYPGAAALGDDLARFLGGHRVEARPDTFSYRAGKFVRRHRGAVAAASLTVLALAAGLAGTAWQARRAERNARTAQANARRAERVQQFLVRVFEGSDPNRNGGASLTAPELLADGTRRIEGELAGEPEVQAALYDAVSQIYRNIGSLTEAQALAERSLAERSRALGPDDPLTAMSRLTLAEARYAKGELEVAERELRAVLPILTRAYGDDGVETIRAKEGLAALLLDQGNGPAALALAEASVASLRRRFGDGHPETARGLHLLGNMQENESHYAEAETTYRVALAALERALGPDHPQTAAARYALAQVLAYVGKRDEGEKQFARALAAQRQSLGDRHPDVGQTLIAVGLLYVNQRRYPEADAAFTEALGIFRPIDHFDAGTCLRMLGNSLVAQEKYAEAASRYEEALEVLRRKRGEKDQLTLTALGNLGNARLRLGQLDAAEPLLRQSVSGLEALLGPDSDTLRAPLNALGEVVRARSPEEAAALHRRALAIQLKAVGPESPAIAGTRHLLALDLLARGRPDDLREARALLDAAIALQRKVDADHPRLDDFLFASGRLARAQGDSGRAHRDLGEALARFQAHHGPEDARTRQARSELSALR